MSIFKRVQKIAIVFYIKLPHPGHSYGNRLFCFYVLDLVDLRQWYIYRNALCIIKFLLRPLSDIVFAVEDAFDCVTSGGGCPCAPRECITSATSFAIWQSIANRHPHGLFLVQEHTVNVSPVSKRSFLKTPANEKSASYANLISWRWRRTRVCYVFCNYICHS